MRDEQVLILTHSDFYHVENTKNPAVSISLRFQKLKVDDASIFVDKSVDDPALPEPFLRGVGIVEGRESQNRVMWSFFTAGAVNIVATNKRAS